MIYECFFAVQIDEYDIVAMPLAPSTYGMIGGRAAECQVATFDGSDEYRMMCVFTDKPHGDELTFERGVLSDNASRIVYLHRNDFHRMYVQ